MSILRKLNFITSIVGLILAGILMVFSIAALCGVDVGALATVSAIAVPLLFVLGISHYISLVHRYGLFLSPDFTKNFREFCPPWLARWSLRLVFTGVLMSILISAMIDASHIGGEYVAAYESLSLGLVLVGVFSILFAQNFALLREQQLTTR